MRFHITHRTSYRYETGVSIGHYMARLVPRELPTQECPWHEIIITPKPSERSVRTDSFGNTTTYFEITGVHGELTIVSRSLVKVDPPELVDPAETPAWEAARDDCAGDRLDTATAALEFAYASPLIPVTSTFADYAATSFAAKRPVLEAALDLNHRIFSDFKFDPAATDVATQVETAFRQRRGVCQDFAQIMIACLRSIGLPARYVSGYLETLPPPGQKKLVGADASHAWVSVWCGETCGWVDLDPTNDLQVSSRHITLAWGRDFSDVSPLRGVMHGAGSQALKVSVDVQPELESAG